MKLLLNAVLSVLFLAGLLAAKNLEIYFIDVEGGQATLMLSPGGESMLIDTGWGGFNRRDAERIAAAAKKAGVKRIDYLVISHFHSDHVGGVAQLAEKLPIRNFVDHGASVETEKPAEILFKSYAAQREKGKHIQVKPGDTIPVKDLDVHVVSAAGQTLTAPLAGAGQPNPECARSKKVDADKSENGQSVGLIVQFGSFRLANLSDLTADKEYDLVCPNNKLGTVDAFLVSHHGAAASNSPQLVRALAPRAAIMENGAKKGGTVEVWQILHDTPGLQDVWQLHYAVAGGKDHNTADSFIANVDEVCEGKWLHMTAMRDGSFTIENGRNKHQKTYTK
jgi:beta-lactamase superfamily II metal-dependent hydrolase